MIRLFSRNLHAYSHPCRNQHTISERTSTPSGKALRRAVELDPDSARYRSSLGVILHATRQYREAEAEKRKAVELAPGSAQYRYSLGVILHELGRYEEAAGEKQKAVELEPDNAQYRSSLDATLERLPEHT